MVLMLSEFGEIKKPKAVLFCRELADFRLGEVTPHSLFELAHFDVADCDTSEPDYLKVKMLAHLADFAVSALVEHHFDIGAVVCSAHNSDLTGSGFATVNHDSARESLCLLGGHIGLYGYMVNLVDLLLWVSYEVRELAVIGHNQKSFAVLIKSADGINALGNILDEVSHAFAVHFIAHCGNEASRLVEHYVTLAALALHYNALVVDVDLINRRVDLVAQNCGFAVKLDRAVFDKLLTLSARSYAAVSHKFLKSYEIVFHKITFLSSLNSSQPVSCQYFAVQSIDYLPHFLVLLYWSIEKVVEINCTFYLFIILF